CLYDYKRSSGPNQKLGHSPHWANKQKDMFEKNYKVLEQKLSSGEQKSERARK
ncbi:CAP-Gly domain-containing linker protein 1, partial [Biomphalaria glabrata]